MKNRLFKILNFFAFNLLFFALYLNFVHRDSNTPAPLPNKTNSATVQGTVLVSNPEQYLNKDAKTNMQTISSTDQKLSYN